MRALQRLSPSAAILAAALLVGVITFMVFSPALRNDFIGWDDNLYVTESPFSIPLSAAAVGMMFSRFYFLSYTPLTHLSHAIDFAVWGLDPRGHHLTNILLHSGNAVLVFFVMLAIIRMRQADRPEGGRLAGSSFPAVLWGCLIAGLFFSLQPLRVESVACASSRKDLLSAFFSFGTVLLYLRYASRRGHTPARRSYLLSLLLFAAAILSKGSVVMIPGVLLLLDLAVEREVRSWRWLLLRLWEKAPFFIIAAAGAYVSYRASISDDMDLVLSAQSHINRLELGSYNLGFYLVKTVWPFRFAAVYDYPGRVASILVSSVPVAVTVLCCIGLFRGKRGPLLGWMAYLLLILPMAGFVMMSIQLTANRYAYLATVPFAIMVGGALTGFLVSHPASARRMWGGIAIGCACAWCAFLAVLVVRDIPEWRDRETVWIRALDVSPTHPLSYAEMGEYLQDKGSFRESIPYYQHALELSPDHPGTLNSLGTAFLGMGDTVSAERIFRATIALSPKRAATYNNLGNLKLAQGKIDTALALYRKALEREPTSYALPYNIGHALMLQGRSREALAMLQQSLALNPNLGNAYYLIGLIEGKQLREEKGALEAFKRAAVLGQMDAQKVLLDRGEVW